MIRIEYNPLLPKLIAITTDGIVKTLRSLLVRLSNLLHESAFRLNAAYLKDGHENMEYVALTSSVSVPADDTTRAVIYVDSSSGDLSVKFKNGDIQILATVSVYENRMTIKVIDAIHTSATVSVVEDWFASDI